jgi:hypothetical protein
MTIYIYERITQNIKSNLIQSNLLKRTRSHDMLSIAMTDSNSCDLSVGKLSSSS